jgi:large subunit ribosomal protein L13
VKTYVANAQNRERNWLLVDASGQTLGRLATQIATALRGKRKPEYTPHVDTGDFVVVVNAEKIAVTGNKLADKRYHRHSGYPGGIKERSLEEKLKVYAGPEHPHVAQKPTPMEIET